MRQLLGFSTTGEDAILGGEPKPAQTLADMTNDATDLLRQRLEAVHERRAAACARVGRDPSTVNIIAVTKTVSVEVARAARDVGLRHLGENRPQELWRKAAALSEGVSWHLIGHLQRNKVERTLPLVSVIHSVDSLRLLEAIESEAARQNRIVNILLEVNASREAAKHGFAPEEILKVADALLRLKQVRVCGLMTMAAFDEDPERTRPTFAQVRGLRDQLAREVGPAHSLEHMSMGMSHDFEVAIEEGATWIRLGTVLFEGLS